jgi:copper chaperone CopZ
MKRKADPTEVENSAALTEVRFRAEMDCRACRYRVQKALKSLDGVRSFDASLRLQQVAVQFDDKVISESAIQKAVEQAVNRSSFDE